MEMVAIMEAGDIVYYYEYWSDSIIKAKVVEMGEYNVKVSSIGVVTYDDQLFVKFSEVSTRRIDRLFSSPKEAYDIYYREQNRRVESYCKQICTVEDLINFPLNHCISNDKEYVNKEARHAYINMAKELLGIEIKVNEKRGV